MKLPHLLILPLALAQMAMAANTPAADSFERVPDGLQGSEWRSIRASHDAWKHRFEVQPEGSVTAQHPAMEWRMNFDHTGFTARPQDGSWQWGLELVLSSSSRAPEHAKPSLTREHPGGTSIHRTGEPPMLLSYRRSAEITEWFINDSRGLEQGWTLSAPAEIHLRIRGNLPAQVSPQSVHFGGTITYSGLKAWDANGKTVSTWFEAAAEGFFVRYDDHKAKYPITIDPIAQQAYLKASNTGAGDGFGTSVAVSGDTVVVGAPYEDSGTTGINSSPNDSATDSGAAYVFARSGTTWSQQAYLKASNTGTEDYFGLSVAISGDTVVVGAFGEASNATGVNGIQTNNSSGFSGAAYVFTRSGATWSQQAYLKASNSEAADNFGYSVAISGDTVVVGADGEASNATGINGNQADNNAYQAGAAYVFTRGGTTWSQQAYLKASNTQGNDRFGWSVAISNNTAVVGAFEESSSATGVNGNQTNNNASRSGASYVFTRNGATWSQQAYLKASNTEADDWFGYSVAVSGDTVVIGASHEDSNATGINGNQANNGSAFTGAAYVFTRSGTLWSQQAYLKASYNGFSINFGSSVAVSGDTVVVGASGEDSDATGVNGNQANVSSLNSGSAYVFSRSGTTWSQQASLKASNTGAGDSFGDSVAVSDGTVVVGTSQEDGNATGVNGGQADNSATNSGAAYVFDLNAALPAPEIAVQQTGSDIANGATTAFGPAVVGTASDFTFIVFNTGTLDLALSGSPKVLSSGSPDFTVIAQPDSPIAGPSGSSGFTVRFAPTGSGLKSASLSIPNNDDDEDPFVIHLSGNALSFSGDTDGDGLNDAAEFNMATLGFDWQISQPALVATFNNGANDAGFYTSAQVQALHVDTPLIHRNQATGQFKLTIGLQKATDLSNFTPYPFNAAQTTVNGEGKIEFLFTSPDNAAFFKLGAE